MRKRKKKSIVNIKIMIKLRDQLNLNNLLKLNDIIIKQLDLIFANDIHLKQISQLIHFELFKNVDSNIINFKNRIQIILTLKNNTLLNTLKIHMSQRFVHRKRFSICFNCLSNQDFIKKNSTLNKQL